MRHCNWKSAGGIEIRIVSEPMRDFGILSIEGWCVCDGALLVPGSSESSNILLIRAVVVITVVFVISVGFAFIVALIRRPVHGRHTE